MNTKLKIVNGIPFLEFQHEFEDEVMLFRIHEAERLANIGGVLHEPGNRIMSDIPVDIEFSKLCIEGSGWK